SETHVVAVVDETDAVLVRPTKFTEDAPGYDRLFGLLGTPADTLVALEATGHYWKNLFAVLVTRGFAVALLNPLRTRRFADEELARTKTDAIDARGIARFAAQKRPAPTRLPDRATEELRELVRLRDRLVQDFGDRRRQHHGAAYRLQVRYACEDLDLLRRRLRTLERDIERTLDDHEIGTLLTTIEGIGPQTAARLIAELGNPAEFRSAAALASYVGVIPAIRQS